MASGGYRPGAGRKKGSKDKKKRPATAKKTKKTKDIVETPADVEKQKLEKMLSYDKQAKASFYQEFLHRLSKGDKLTLQEKKHMEKLGVELAAGLNDEEKTEAVAEDLDPLSYMLKVMNDPGAEKERRDRMAIASAPFLHSRNGEGMGKKEEIEERAKKAGQGKFAPMRPPTLKAVK